MTQTSFDEFRKESEDSQESDGSEVTNEEQLAETPDAAEYELFSGADNDPLRPPEELTSDAFDEAPKTENNWTYAPTNYHGVRYAVDVDPGGLIIIAESQKTSEWAVDVRGYDETGELIDWVSVEWVYGSESDALDDCLEYIRSNDPEEAWEAITGGEADTGESESNENMSDPDAGEWPAFDEYGHTMDEPIPFAERTSKIGPDPVDPRELTRTALSPFDLCHIGDLGWKLVDGMGYHPDDEHRERDEPDELIAEDLAKIQNQETEAMSSTDDPIPPSNVHTDYSELEDIPENVPICAAEADCELAKRALRKARREYGHHDPTRQALRSFYRDVDDREKLKEAARNLGPNEINMATIPGETEAWAVLHWLESEHSDLVDEARSEFVDELRQQCEKALEEQRTREQDREFRENPPEEVNGWERFESEKPDVEIAYRAANYGTPSVVAVYRDGSGEFDAHESVIDEWETADTGSKSKVNRHFVSVTNDRSVFGDLRNHLQKYDGEPIDAVPEPVEGYDRLLNPNRLEFDDDSEFYPIAGYHNENTDHLVGVYYDGDERFIVGEGDTYQDYQDVTVYRIRRTFAVVNGKFEHPDLESGVLTDPNEVAEVATGLMEYGNIQEFQESVESDGASDPDTGSGSEGTENGISEPIAADGGQEIDPSVVGVDPDNPPANETVRLITGITGMMHTPEVIEGEASTSGKTISVEHQGKTHRLDTETILSGDSEFRDSRYFEIYTRERLRSNQRSNHAPGPQAGANDVSDASDLPPATHRPPGEDERERERAERREEAEKKREERKERLGFEDVENGARLIMDAHAGEYLVIRKVRQWDSVTGLELLGPDGNEYELTEATGDATYWLTDEGDQRAIVSNVDAMDDVEAFEIIGTDTEKLRRYLREQR